MISGVQPKVLLIQTEDDNLELEPKYKLVRERDGLTKTSTDVKWLEFNEDGKYKADFKDIAIGRSLLMSPFNNYFTWQSTLITEIIEHREDYIKFRTENSNYELIKIK